MAAILAVLAVGAVPAFGQASFDGYSDQAGQQQAAVQGGGDSGGGGGGGVAGTEAGAQPVAESDVAGASDTATEGTLPFTGLDIGLLIGASAVLILAGVGMRRLTRAPGSA